MSIAPFDILVRQITLVGAPSLNRNIPAAVEMLKKDGGRMKKIISNRVPLQDIPACLATVGRPEVMKVMFAA